MDKKQVFEMLKNEISGKQDEDTKSKLNNAKSSKEALAILEGVSIELDDEMLSAVSAGSDDENENGELQWCATKIVCRGQCPHYCYLF